MMALVASKWKNAEEKPRVERLIDDLENEIKFQMRLFEKASRGKL